MEASAQHLFAKGLATSTQRTYKSGQDRFLKFCTTVGSTPLPVDEASLCSFVAHLVESILGITRLRPTYLQCGICRYHGACQTPFTTLHFPGCTMCCGVLKRRNPRVGRAAESGCPSSQTFYTEFTTYGRRRGWGDHGIPNSCGQHVAWHFSDSSELAVHSPYCKAV